MLVLVSLSWTFVVRTLRKLAFGAQRADGGELPGGANYSVPVLRTAGQTA